MKRRPFIRTIPGTAPGMVRMLCMPFVRWSAAWAALAVILFAVSGCAFPAQQEIAEPVPTKRVGAAALPLPSATATAAATVTATQTPSITPTPLPSATPTITPTPEPPGCWQPPDDYTRVEVNGWVLNQRTYAMLEHAASLYGGELEITGYHLTQGSYNTGVSASFGTHDGGGAVDLSVMRKGTWTVLWEEIDRLIPALRAAGFAAWLRTYGELGPDSPYHIHAIAIGDRDLSPAASNQLTGPFGYFRGYTGVPIPSGIPAPDRHNGPVLCQWMLDLGYADLRDAPE